MPRKGEFLKNTRLARASTALSDAKKEALP
jgi:hypothetical protein